MEMSSTSQYDAKNDIKYAKEMIPHHQAEFRPPGVTRLPPLWGAARFYYSAALSSFKDGVKG